MSRSKLFTTSLIAAAGLAFVAVTITCNRAPQNASAQRPSGPALTRPDGVAAESWLQQWQAKLPVTATLAKGSKQQSGFGFGSSGFGLPSGTNRTYKLHLELRNQTGYPLETASSLYIVETAIKPAPGLKPEQVLIVAGGYFKKQPLEDFSGVAEFRERSKTSQQDQDAPDREDFGLYNAQTRTESGLTISRLGPIFSFSTGGSPRVSGPAFGNADPGGTLTIDTELELAVMVTRDKQEKVVVVSPRLILRDQKGETASFRYLLEFEAHPGGVRDREGDLALAGPALLPMTGETLLPLVTEPSGPLWRRVFAAQWAGFFGKQSAAPALTAIVSAKGKENDVLRASAILGLGAGKQTSATELIMGIAADKSEHSDARSAATKALGRLGDKRATPILISLAEGREEGRAKEAITSLGQLRDAAATEPLLRILENNGRNALHSPAGEALGKLAGDGALDRLERLAKNRKAKGGADAVSAMGGIGTPKAVTLLSGIYQSGSDDVRKNVSGALGKIDRPEALAALKTALQDKNKDVREAALNGIGEVKNAERAAVLVAALSDQGTELKLREKAAGLLHNFPGEGTQQALVKALADPAPSVRKAGVQALGELQAKSAAGEISKALLDGDSGVRSAAAAALEKAGDKSAFPVLVEALLKEKDDSAVQSQVSTLIALGYKDRSAFPQFVSRLKEVSGGGRTSLASLLKQLSGKEFGPEYGATPQQVDESIAKWTEWWKAGGGK